MVMIGRRQVTPINLSQKQTAKMSTMKKYLKRLTPAKAGALIDAWDYCDTNDKSTEFMLQYMQDMGKVDLDTVLWFLKESPDEMNYEQVNEFWRERLSKP